MDGQHNASATTVGDARRAQIVHAARAICLEKGFSKITISDIAGRVGMTRSLFYHYSKTKTKLRTPCSTTSSTKSSRNWRSGTPIEKSATSRKRSMTWCD